MVTRRRLSREDSREQTRALLRRSAVKVFARSGFEGASVDEIAEGAGFSRGAFYSNFSDKEELFLELLNQHLERDLEGFQRAVDASSSLENLAQKIAASYADRSASTDWCLLASEFQLYLSRTGKPGSAFAMTYKVYRQRLAERLEAAFKGFGLRADMTFDEIASTLIGLTHGLALERAASRSTLPAEVTGKAIRALLFGVTQERRP